jgi:hypothetical protein
MKHRESDRQSERILNALRNHPEGLTRTEINITVFKRHLRADRLREAVTLLKQADSIESKIEKTRCRHTERFLVTANEINEISEVRPVESLRMNTQLTHSQITQFLATAETVDAKLSSAAIGLDIIRRKAADVGRPMNELIEFLIAQGYSRVAQALGSEFRQDER